MAPRTNPCEATRRLAPLILLAAVVFTLGGCVERTAPPPRPSEPIGPIWGPYVAAQTFAARDLPLVGLDVQLATYARTNQGTVTLRLRSRAEGPDLRTVAVVAADLQDNGLRRFRFDALSASPPSGQQPTWTFLIESSASSLDDAITIWASAGDVVPGGAATYDGGSRDVDLVFTPVYAEPVSAAIGLQIDRLRSSWPEPIVPIAVVFLPGLLLAQLFLSRSVHGFGLQLAASPAFGLAAAPLLTLYAPVFGARLSPVAVWVLLGGCALALLVIEVAIRCRGLPSGSVAIGPGLMRAWDWSVVIALGATLAGLVARGIALQDGPVPPGADTYHHALIAQLFVEQGGIPTSYRPYAEIDSFSYHFGFHALAGLNALATGGGGLGAVAAVAPLVSVLPALSVFFLVRAVGMGRTAAIVAALALALVDPFPVALLGIGRYPQEAALAIFPVALALGLGYTGRPNTAPTRLGLARLIVGAGVLAAGLFLTHYRVILYLAIVLAIHTGWALARAGRADLRLIWPTVRLPLALATVALVLCAPWLARLAQGFSLGLRGSEGRYAPAYYAVDRLGDVLTHPAVPALLVVALLGVGLAVLARQPLVILLGVAFVAQLALSNPHWIPIPGAGWVDTVTVVSSAFVAVSVSVGFLAGRVNHVLVGDFAWISPLRRFRRSGWVGARPPPRGPALNSPGGRGQAPPLPDEKAMPAGTGPVARRLGRLATPLVALALGGAAVWGGLQLPSVVEPGHRLVQDADLAAIAWSRAHLPSDAKLLANTFVLHWNPDFVAPTDAGYFLPLLANRQTTLLPMVYPAERGIPPGVVDRMEAIARATAVDPTSPEALALLHEAGVTHVYLGVRRGPIPEYRLANSPVFRRAYQDGGVSIYELLPSAGR